MSSSGHSEHSPAGAADRREPRGVVSIAAAVRAGQVRAVDMIEAHESRATQSDLGAIVTPLWERARQAAKRIDRMQPAQRAQLPLAGVPVTVKDLMCVAGVPTSAGSSLWAQRPARADASVVAAVQAAGALIVGKTNLPPFAIGTITDNERFGPTLNPLAPDRTPGGSSGGEAAAVAASLSAAGLGSDYGGSLRWPAQCTGVCALRPTPGRVPATGQVPGAGGTIGDTTLPQAALNTLQGQLQVIGPVATAIADLRALLEVMARPDGVDLRVPSLAVPALAGTSHLRVGWSNGDSIGPVRSEVAQLIAHLAAQLTALFTAVTELPTVFDGCLGIYNEIRSLEPSPDHFLAFGTDAHLVPAAVRDQLAPAPGATPEALARAWGAGLEIRRRALTVFDQVDVVLLPVAAGPAARLDGSLDVDGDTVSSYDLMAHCRAVTLLGAPVVSMPVGTSAEGLPLSLQVIAAPWRDHLALDVAARIEALLAVG
jgi:amidase